MALEDLNGIANVQFTETVTWETATDWDNAVDRQGVVHDTVADRSDASLLQLGYPVEDPGGSALGAYWPHDEDSGGTLNDRSGNGNDGTVNGASQSQTGFGQTTAYQFDGTDDYIKVPDSATLDGSGGFTISMWIKPLDIKVNDWSKRILHKEYSDVGGTQQDESWGWSYTGDGTEHLWFGERTNGSYGNSLNSGILSADTWYHMAVTRDGSDGSAALYQDGAQQETTTFSWASNSNPIIWCERSNSYSQAVIDEVLLFQRGFSAQEVSDYLYISQGSYLTTATKTVSTAGKPDLTDLDYDLNGESIDVTAIGSPGAAGEERVTQTLDGASSYSLSWSNPHTDFRVQPEPEVADPTNSPVVRSISLTT
jgi:hypothetical protein